MSGLDDCAAPRGVRCMMHNGLRWHIKTTLFHNRWDQRSSFKKKMFYSMRQLVQYKKEVKLQHLTVVQHQKVYDTQRSKMKHMHVNCIKNIILKKKKWKGQVMQHQKCIVHNGLWSAIFVTAFQQRLEFVLQFLLKRNPSTMCFGILVRTQWRIQGRVHLL